MRFLLSNYEEGARSALAIGQIEISWRHQAQDGE
jgi:hypothetical protein